METKYIIKLDKAELYTIIDALGFQNYRIKKEILEELAKDKKIKNQKEFNEKYQEILESSISYILEKELLKILK